MPGPIPFFGRHARSAFAALALLGGWACSARPADDRVREPGSTTAGRAPAAALAPLPVPSPARPVLVLADPNDLRELEGRGLDAGSLAFGGPAPSAGVLSTRAGYRDIVATLRTDLEADRRRDRHAGVGMRHAHRQLDAEWLVSPAFRYELVAVVNRLDRRPFTPGHCGEVRFVYRLGYAAPTPGGLSSRVPLTMNVVFLEAPGSDGGCREAAERWHVDEGVRPDATWALSPEGPLAPDVRARWAAKSVEIDAQTVRWPSTVRPNMAGHAEYTLRVFHPSEEGRYAEAPLENTLDVERLERSAATRAELRAWLSQAEVLAAIDEGTVVVPDAYLSRRAVSVTPHGLARLANRVFASTFGPEDFRDVDLGGYATFSSPRSLLRRLDGLSCPGCHQSRSIAGFHILGAEADGDMTDALEMGMSPHFHDELERRRHYVAALASDQVPEELRPAAEHPPGSDGVFSHCGLGDPGLSSWTCADGLECRSVGDNEVGMCLAPGDGRTGDPCESGPVSAHGDPHKDAVHLGPPRSCAGSRACERNAVGFPAGMCAGPCDGLESDAVCGRIAILEPFNRCIAAGRAFDQCLAEATRPGALRRCSFHESCRDDMVCARTPDGGACLPPYFLLQLRVDGHVPPRVER